LTTVISVTQSPAIRPALARISSARSGFIFCGISDEPDW
jgi:hypothetical protein